MTSRDCPNCGTIISAGDRYCTACGTNVNSEIDGYQDAASLAYFDAHVRSGARRLLRRFIIRTIATASFFLFAEGVVWGLLIGIPNLNPGIDTILAVVINIGMLVLTASSAVVLKSRLRFPVGNVSSWVISLTAWLVFTNLGRSVGEIIVS